MGNNVCNKSGFSNSAEQGKTAANLDARKEVKKEIFQISNKQVLERQCDEAVQESAYLGLLHIM